MLMNVTLNYGEIRLVITSLRHAAQHGALTEADTVAANRCAATLEERLERMEERAAQENAAVALEAGGFSSPATRAILRRNRRKR